MNVQTSPHLLIATASNDLRKATLIASAVIIGILAIYYQTAWSMVSTWNRSDTYAHGFFILPFCVYMIWTRRQQLVQLEPRPNLLALLVFSGIGFVWFIATLASVQIVTQYMLVAMIPVVVWVLLGNRIFIATAFPLAYLLFAVPFGDVLIPPLIDFTADFTVNALQFSGIPVYREGTFFSLPTGNWSVVEACSGLRYLIASVTLGTLYAYLTYHSYLRRFAFIILSIIVPIIANGIRAYLIVMTGHLSGMQLAVGVDHLIYGWVFFGFVMLLLFWIGSFWREDDKQETIHVNHQLKHQETSNIQTPLKKTLLVACSVFAIAFIWPISAAHLKNKTVLDSTPEIEINSLSSGWSINTKPMTDWEPIYVGTPSKFYSHFQKANQTVNLYINYYHNQHQGNELISFGNILVTADDPNWRVINETKRTVIIDAQEIIVRQTQLRSVTTDLLVWRWYWLGDEETINPYIAKALLARNKLFSKNIGGAEILLASTFNEQSDEAATIMEAFLRDMKASILEGLRHTSGHL